MASTWAKLTGRGPRFKNHPHAISQGGMISFSRRAGPGGWKGEGYTFQSIEGGKLRGEESWDLEEARAKGSFRLRSRKLLRTIRQIKDR